MSNLRTLDNADIDGKTVFLRADLNVPIQDGVITSDERIIRTIPTIEEILSKGAKLVIASHLGRPKGEGFEAEFSLSLVAKKLEELMGKTVTFCSDCIGDEVESVVKNASLGDIILLENLRFYKQEKKNDENFVKQLANLADVYVSDAFSTSHRAHASTVGLANILPGYAGRLMQEEVEHLQKALEIPNPPVAAVVGGAKISTKLGVLNNLVNKVNYLIVCGGMANTFHYALGADIGKSLSEKDMADECLKIIERAKVAGCEIVLTSDAVCALELKEHTETKIVKIGLEAMGDYEILDAGPESIKNLKETLATCKTVLWNGPLGAFEFKPFDNATNEVAGFVGDMTDRGDMISVAGGGDTVSALQTSGADKKFSYISTAGGAFLEWIEGRELPGVKILMQ